MLIPVEHSARSVDSEQSEQCSILSFHQAIASWVCWSRCHLSYLRGFHQFLCKFGSEVVGLHPGGVPRLANHLFKMIFAVVWASYSSCAHGIASANLVKWSIMTSSPLFPDVVLHSFKWQTALGC